MNGVKNSNEEIKQLIISYLSGNTTEDDDLHLKEWIEENRQHKEYFEKLRALWILSGKHAGEQKFNPELQWTILNSKMQSVSKPRRIKVKIPVTLGIAASWIILFALGYLWHNNSIRSFDSQLKTTEISAPLGAKSVIKLPDGTTVWLNAGSKITYNQDFDKKDRNIHLIGEAYFSVASNKAKPFIVNTSGIAVKALGTRFNVKAYPEEKTITATLEEGKIDVHVLNDRKGNKQIILTPNQKVVYYKKTNDFKDNYPNKTIKTKALPNTVSSNDQDLEIAHNVNTELYTSWKDDRWIIESMPLVTLAPMLERRFNMNIKFDKEDLKNYNFTGTIEKETIEQILAAMRFTAPIDYEIQKDTILLTLNKHLKNQYSRLVKPKTN